MRSAQWYDQNSYCEDTTRRHESTEIKDVTGEFVGWICVHCFEPIVIVRRGSDLYIRKDLT